jgi:nucleolar protein 12
VRASPSKATPIPTPGSSKRKHAETEPVTALPTVFKPFKKKTRLSNAMVEAAEDHSLEKPSKKVKKTKSTTSLQPDDASDSDDAGLEDAYLAKAVKPAPSKTSALSDEDTFKSDDKEGDDVVPIHESVAKEKRKRDRKSGARKEKYVPADETPAMRNARTIFIGNVPAEATKSRVRHSSLIAMIDLTIFDIVSPCKSNSSAMSSLTFHLRKLNLSAFAQWHLLSQPPRFPPNPSPI